MGRYAAQENPVLTAHCLIVIFFFLRDLRASPASSAFPFFALLYPRPPLPRTPLALYHRPTARLAGGSGMAMDQELQRHRETWLGFARLMRWSIAGIVIVLVLMAIFLL